MTPLIFVNNSFYSPMTNTKSFSHFMRKLNHLVSFFRPLFFYNKDLFRFKFRCPNLFTSSSISTSFFMHIKNIISCCSKPKMFWIYACSIISKWKTIMEDKKIPLNGSVMEDPGGPMRKHLFSIKSNFPIFIIFRFFPNPAMGCLFYISEESIFKWFCFCLIVACHTFFCSMIDMALTARTSFDRIILHLKVSPLGVMPPAAITARGFFVYG